MPSSARSGGCLWQSIDIPAFQPFWGAAFANLLVPFRLYIELCGDLHGLPRELLGHQFGQCCVLRYEKWETVTDCEAALWPVRLLVVVGARQGDVAVSAEAEVTAIRKAVREVDRSIFLRVLERPTSRPCRSWKQAHSGAHKTTIKL